MEPLQSMSTDDLREDLGRRGLDTDGGWGVLAVRLEEHRRSVGSDAGEGGAWCSWRGKVCELEGHLAESCLYEPAPCPNAAGGCEKLVLRKDAAGHASETCEYQPRCCEHCKTLFKSRDLHEGSCPEEQIECPNAGCGVTLARRSMAEHRGVCGREEVQCPCPGCEERMVRAAVGEHVEASGAVHLRLAWRRAAEMEEKVAEQGRTIATLQGLTAPAIFGCGHLFTWSIDGSFNPAHSLPHTFTEGVIGRCFSMKSVHVTGDFVMGFALLEGPACKMNYKCMIMGKDDKVLRVVSEPVDVDFRKPPQDTAPVGQGRAARFNLTAADKAGAVRADGSIKLRMAVYLHLSE